MRTVSPSEISIVINGPTGTFKDRDLALQTLESVQRILPGAEIVFSTWNGSLLVPSDGIRLIHSSDPGGYLDINERPVNINRQIVAVNAGLAVITKPFVLKIRHDTPLVNANLTNFPVRVEDSVYRLFNHKISMPNICVRNPKAMMQLFSICDLVQFGMAEDIKKLWCLPLLIQNEHYSSLAMKTLFKRSNGPTMQRFVAEQYNLLYLKHITDQIDAPWTNSVALIDDCMKTWNANFSIIDFEKSGIIFPHRVFNPKYLRDTFVSQKIIDEYCNWPIDIQKKWCVTAAKKISFPFINNKAGYISILANLLHRLPRKTFSIIRNIYRKKIIKSN